MKTRKGKDLGKPRPALHLEYHNPAAASVYVAGSFNEWHPAATEMVKLGGGLWAKDLTLEEGEYEYRLVVDGRWIPDPAAKETAPNPFGGVNSVARVRA
jgi:1,4-alpha-glucan branching enzyme